VRGAPAQQRAHALQQLEHTERLRHVLVRIEPEAEHLVRFRVARAEDDHRRPPAARAQRAEHPVAVERAGQHQVEDDEVGGPFADDGECARPVAGDAHVVTLDLEIVREPGGEIRVVLDHEHATHRAVAARVSACRSATEVVPSS
jgi:hypothetical protein